MIPDFPGISSRFCAEFLSFLVVMRERLNLPPAWDGNLWICGHLGRARPVHRHAELEFNLVTQGEGTYLLANRRYRIGRGDLLWLFPGQEHVLVEESADFQMWVGVFRPRMVRRVATDPGSRVLGLADPPGEYCRRLGRGDLDRLVGLLTEVEATRDRPALFNTGSAYALMATWRAFEGAVDVPVGDVHPAVEKAARLIRSDPGVLRLGELARRSGLSPSRLSRLFKGQTGITWVDFRNRERIKRFLHAYGSGQRRNVIDAALQAGFGSYPQFHRVFRRVMGCTLASHRRRSVK
jgi:AraC-like DNA-binding protein